LLDIWPLRRASFPKTTIEKLPLFVLSGAGSVVTWLAQGSSGSMQVIPLLYRLRSALVSYLVYLAQTVWPVNLAVFYPYDVTAVWLVVLAGFVLATITLLAVRYRHSRPYIAVGWFWFLGTLVPVIGIVQVGSQSHADRYTYIPMVGLSMMLGWGIAEFVNQ